MRRLPRPAAGPDPSSQCRAGYLGPVGAFGGARPVVSLAFALIAGCGGGNTSTLAPGLSLDNTVVAATAYAAGATDIDLDGDGRFEWHLEGRVSNGPATRETIDVNADGQPDMVWEQVGPDSLLRIDRNGDGAFEYIVKATPTLDGRTLFVVTEDTTGDFVPDHRMTLTTVPGTTSAAVAHEFDYDQDGVFEVGFSTTSSGGARQSAISGLILSIAPSPAPLTMSPHVPLTVDSTCTPAQANDLRNALDAAVAQGASCFAKLDNHLGMAFLRLAATGKLQINCGLADPTICAVASRSFEGCTFGVLGCPDVVVSVHMPYNPACGPLASTLFHEILHYLLGLHSMGDGTGDLGDPVYGCEQTCFGKASSLTCAACLRTVNGDSRCGGYPPQACPATVPAGCPCGPCRAGLDPPVCAPSCTDVGR